MAVYRFLISAVRLNPETNERESVVSETLVYSARTREKAQIVAIEIAKARWTGALGWSGHEAVPA